MIVVDTSALMAVLRGESDCEPFLEILGGLEDIVIGAPTKFELLLVMGGWKEENGIERANRLLAASDIQTVDWTNELADIAGVAFLRFGKGRHPAKLNFGDCMAYALAKSLDAPLLFKGDDFSKTDIKSAL